MSAHQNVTCYGMTLVEVVIATSLFTVLMLTVMNTVVSLYQNNATAIAQATEIDNGRRGISNFIQDVREMTYADDGAFPLVVMQPNKIGFYSDIDRDDSVEYVEYVYTSASTTLQKNIYNATGTPAVYNLATPDQKIIVSQYVQNVLSSTSTFFYYDASGVTVSSSSNISDVRYIKGQIIVNVNPNKDPGLFLINGSALLRNLN